MRCQADSVHCTATQAYGRKSGRKSGPCPAFLASYEQPRPPSTHLLGRRVKVGTLWALADRGGQRRRLLRSALLGRGGVLAKAEYGSRCCGAWRSAACEGSGHPYQKGSGGGSGAVGGAVGRLRRRRRRPHVSEHPARPSSHSVGQNSPTVAPSSLCRMWGMRREMWGLCLAGGL